MNLTSFCVDEEPEQQEHKSKNTSEPVITYNGCVFVTPPSAPPMIPQRAPETLDDLFALFPTCSGRAEEEDCGCAKLLHASRQIGDGHLVCLVLFLCVEK